MTRLAGVDGCRRGWIAALGSPTEPGRVELRVVASLGDLLRGGDAPDILAVDIPIGLPDRAARGGRAAERLIAPLLGPRRSSVFATPSRAAVWAARGPYPSQAARRAAYGRACEIARATSDPPAAPSIQAFGIFPKIREVDRLLQDEPALRPRVFEVHPEAAFWAMNGGTPLPAPKKTPAGAALRRDLLVAAGLPRPAVEAAPPPGAGSDDLLDALAALVVAGKIAAGRARPFPDRPETDRHGLPMAIWV